MKRIICFVLCLTLISASLLETVVYGAWEPSNISAVEVESASGSILTVSGILRQFDVSEDWLDEQLSKGYTLYQIYTALQGEKRVMRRLFPVMT